MNSGAMDDRGVRTSERVYRALMRAYPEEVRRRYADEMVGYFGDLCREERLSRGAGGMTLLWARTLPDLLFTALRERGALFRRNAYLPVGPGTVARWGALCALIGGMLGFAFHLIEYSLLGALNVSMGSFYGDDPFTRFFTLSILLSALSLSSLGLFGLYGTVVARSSEARPGLLAGAGAIFSAASAFLWLSISGYGAVHALASGSAFFAPFEWLWNAGSLLIGPAFLFWFLGLLLLGIAAALRPLPRLLRVLPLALFALMVPGYLSGGYFEMIGGPQVVSVIVMGLGQGLPFVGVAVLGWALLRSDPGEPVTVSGEPAEGDGTDREATGPVSRAAGGAWTLAALLLSLVLFVGVYSARDGLYRTYLGLQPDAQNVGKAAYAAGERFERTKTAGGARVTLDSVYAEERYVIVGYEVEDLTDGRRVGEHPAELQPLIGFEGDEEQYQKDGLGNDIVELTDQGGTDFRMVDNSGQVSESPNSMVRGPMQHMVAFEPDQGLEPGETHRFSLKVPLMESPVVTPGQKMPPGQPFEGGPFLFEFEVPVRAAQVVEVGQKDTADGITLTLERVTDSPGHPEVVICLESMDGVRGWVPGGRDLGFEYFKPVAGEGDCLLMPLSRPLDGRPSVTVDQVEINPFCPSCAREEDVIRGPWTFEFEVPDS